MPHTKMAYTTRATKVAGSIIEAVSMPCETALRKIPSNGRMNTPLKL